VSKPVLLDFVKSRHQRERGGRLMLNLFVAFEDVFDTFLSDLVIVLAARLAMLSP